MEVIITKWPAFDNFSLAFYVEVGGNNSS